MDLRTHPSSLLIGLFLACLTVSGCGSEDTAETVTYHRDIRPLLESQCLDCHRQGDIGPYALDSYERAKKYAAISWLQIKTGKMPPWPADPTCNEYVGQRLLSKQEKALFERWVESGTAEGDPATYVAPKAKPDPYANAGPATVTLKAEKSYVPNGTVTDDYRCFDLTHTFEKETFVQMTRVLPDQKDLVHHVLVYAVKKPLLGMLRALDEADPGVGYTCFGGAGIGAPTPVAGWAPGNETGPLPPDSGIRIPAGICRPRSASGCEVIK